MTAWIAWPDRWHMTKAHRWLTFLDDLPISDSYRNLLQDRIVAATAGT
jgi:hypothetical protein